MSGGTLGVTRSKGEDFPEWYVEVVRKGGFVDQRTPVRGCDVITPWGYGVWERIAEFADRLFKERGVKNAYFPALIPESLLKKEEEHFAGFTPEVAWVTEAGDSKLGERLALRPTSETIMYYMFSQWVRSYRDLPLRINQWTNVFRWETKATRPFLRSREFLWQEGHTVHATLEDADQEVREMIKTYKKIFEELAALPALVLQRTESDKFAGALYSVAFDTFVPEAGRALQIGTVHNLGQNFAKAFGIKFLDRDGNEKYAWQTSWGISTRLIGAILAVHGDDRGAVLPPKVAPVQVVVVPIVFKGKEAETVQKATEIGKMLEKMGVRVEVDSRDEYTAGWKFNHWELKGVPLRIEVGPKDIGKGGVTYARRDTGEKGFVKETELEKVVAILDDIQANLFKRAQKKLDESIVTLGELEQVEDAMNRKKIARTFWCGDPRCEERIKEETGGEIRGIKFGDGENVDGESCVVCGKRAKHVVYVAKSY